jgi:ADP-ribosylglycohydrolase
MQSIVNREGIDYGDILSEFRLYAREGKYTQYGTFDYGYTTGAAIDRFESGVKPLECGGTSGHEITNGSLMRILPWAFIDDIDFETVENACRITHGHELCIISCVLYIEIAKSMLENDLEISEHIERSCVKIKERYAESDWIGDFDRIFNNDLDEVASGFYVVETLECALHCLLTTSTYREAVLKAVNLGEDTDTVAAVCGGLAGIYYGFDDIPSEWIDDIPQIDYVIGLCDEFEALPIIRK